MFTILPCYELKLYSFEIHMLKSQPPVPANVIVFEDRVIKEVTELK